MEMSVCNLLIELEKLEKYFLIQKSADFDQFDFSFAIDLIFYRFIHIKIFQLGQVFSLPPKYMMLWICSMADFSIVTQTRDFSEIKVSSKSTSV